MSRKLTFIVLAILASLAVIWIATVAWKDLIAVRQSLHTRLQVPQINRDRHGALARSQREGSAPLTQDSDPVAKRAEIYILLSTALTIILGLIAAHLAYTKRASTLEENPPPKYPFAHEKIPSLGTIVTRATEEIANPLTSINARVYCIQQSLDQNCVAQEHLSVIIREVQRIEKILLPLSSACRIFGKRRREIPTNCAIPQINSKN